MSLLEIISLPHRDIHLLQSQTLLVKCYRIQYNSVPMMLIVFLKCPTEWSAGPFSYPQNSSEWPAFGPLKSCHNSVIFCQYIHNLSLALISPLEAKNHICLHILLLIKKVDHPALHPETLLPDMQTSESPEALFVVQRANRFFCQATESNQLVFQQCNVSVQTDRPTLLSLFFLQRKAGFLSLHIFPPSLRELSSKQCCAILSDPASSRFCPYNVRLCKRKISYNCSALRFLISDPFWHSFNITLLSDITLDFLQSKLWRLSVTDFISCSPALCL